MFPGLTGTSRSETLIEMICGMLLYGVAGQMLLLFIPGNKMLFSTGWWIGIAMAIACGYHMWWVLDNTLGAGEGAAIKKVALMSVVRYLIIVAVVVLVTTVGIGNPISTVFGLLALKFGAYLQPFIHFLRKKLFGYEEEIRGKEEET